MKNIVQKDSQQSTEVSLLPQHPFVLPCCGAISSGKTTLLVNMLTSKEFYKQQFNRIIFISVTANLDEKIKEILECPDICVSNQKLQDAMDNQALQLDDYFQPTILPRYHGINEDDIHSEYLPEILRDLYAEQKFTISYFGKQISDKVLVCVDDAITSGIYRQGHSSEFAKFATSLRHVNCSVIHCSQLFKAIPKIIRTQSTAGVFCGIPNELELKDVYEIFSCSLPLHKWSEYFNVIVNKPFQPIVFNLKNPRGYKMQRAFQEFVA